MEKILGIELGSTRIKAVLTDEYAQVIAQGSFEWENELVGGLWSYSLASVETGLHESYKNLKEDYRTRHGAALTELSAIGISAMMHGYLAFDRAGELLVPFRTWRNTNTERAAAELSDLFRFNVPMRWSVSHYYQAVLDGEEHIDRVDFLTTLAGYVHLMLTGERVLGVGDASGMFPIRDGNYNTEMLAKLNTLLLEKGVTRHFESLLPTVLTAGECAGRLTEEGALWLDPTGELKAGCILCPPEGDAGTGMVATNSTTPRTANVSAGTSAFLMAVLEREPLGYYKEIDVVTTPDGSPVAMVHVNNFTSEMTQWTNLFEEVIALAGGSIDRGSLFEALYLRSLESDGECGGLVGYNFLSGEPIAGVSDGVPLIARNPSGRLTLAGFMRMHIYSALAALSMGVDILKNDGVVLDKVYGHGGFFKTERVGQLAMSAALGTSVTVMQNAGEGGAWGIAVLALFAFSGGRDLTSFLAGIFKDTAEVTLCADESERSSFGKFMEKYKKGLSVERLAGEVF